MREQVSWRMVGAKCLFLGLRWVCIGGWMVEDCGQ